MHITLHDYIYTYVVDKPGIGVNGRLITVVIFDAAKHHS